MHSEHGNSAARQADARLASLTDEEVIERMSRLTPTHTYDPDIVLRNIEVREGMRDDVV